MKKVININFQGRVIPIEESAYDILKQYIESLRRYFANEEGRDEIINDIETRIGELFYERLKSGTTCITDADVDTVIAGMGRPEDFDAQDAEIPPASSATAGSGGSKAQSGPRILSRNADDKIIAGVCSGIANYLRIDPIVVRIVFVLLIGFFWAYLLLWVILPSRSLKSDITKRLYRNPDDKVIGGVAGGLAVYFNIQPWIPRLIFALPLILGIISKTFDALWWDWNYDFGPGVLSGSFGGTLFIAYLILWIALPKANTAAEKLEMRGEKVDLNSIATTVKEDLEQFRQKAEKWGEEVKDSAKNISREASARFTGSAGATRENSTGIGRAIAITFKAFFMLVFGMTAISLFVSFIALMFGGFALAPFKAFLLESTMQNVLAWTTVLLVLVLPFVAFVTWCIRRLMGVRSRRHSVGVAFFGLWIAGLACALLLLFLLSRSFKRNSVLEEERIVIEQPKEKLYIDVEKDDWRQYPRQFFGIDVDGDVPFFMKGNDSLMLNTVRISMAKSKDSAFHVYRMKASRGRTEQDARNKASKIFFEPVQQDSALIFPQGFFISNNEKFRNQRVWIVVEVPAGKRIEFSNTISKYDWFDIHGGNRYEDNWNPNNYLYTPQPGREYVMDEDGRPRVVNNADRKAIDITFEAH